MRLKELSYLFILAALWGASFLFVRIASPALGPFITIELRVFIAASVLILYAWIKGKKLDVMQRWKEYLFLGAVNAGIPFTFIAVASLNLPSSVASIINATSPVFGGIIAWLVLKEEFSLKRIIGMIISFTGVIILMGWSTLPKDIIIYLSAGASITASFFYGIGIVYIKKRFQGSDFLSMSIGQQLGASLVVLPTVFIPFNNKYIDLKVILSIVGLSVFCTALAYFFYFYLIENVGPTKAITVTFLIPFFGVLWGAIFLNEVVTFGMTAALITIITGVFLATDVKISNLF